MLIVCLIFTLNLKIFLRTITEYCNRWNRHVCVALQVADVGKINNEHIIPYVTYSRCKWRAVIYRRGEMIYRVIILVTLRKDKENPRLW